MARRRSGDDFSIKLVGNKGSPETSLYAQADFLNVNKFEEWKKRKEEIKALIADGKKQTEIARKYGISRQRVQQIITDNVSYKRWYVGLSPEERRTRWLKRKEKSVVYNREWKKRNRQKVAGYVRTWESKNPEKVLKYRREGYYRHREQRLAQQSRRYWTDKKAQEYKKEWNKQRYIRLNLGIVGA